MKPYKKSLNFSYSIGVYPTLELLQSRPEQVTRLMINPKGYKNQGFQQIVHLCRQHQIKVEQIDEGTLRKISETENCYAIGVFNKYESPLIVGNHLVLVSPSDRGNLGTIIRTMLAFNLKILAIIRPAVDIFDPKVIRAAMGASFQLNFQYFDSLAQYRQSYRNQFYMFTPTGGKSLVQLKFLKPYSLVFGNEGAGFEVSDLKVGEQVSIPQSNQVDSLNLSISVGIALYSASLQST